MDNQKNTKNETLLDDDLCAVMGKQRQEGAEIKQPVRTSIGRLAAETSAGIDHQPERKTIDILADEKEKMLTEQRRRQISYTARWISFLVAMAYFLCWATKKDLVSAVIAIPGLCICAAVGGYHLGGCLSDLKHLQMVKSSKL